MKYKAKNGKGTIEAIQYNLFCDLKEIEDFIGSEIVVKNIQNVNAIVINATGGLSLVQCTNYIVKYPDGSITVKVKEFIDSNYEPVNNPISKYKLKHDLTVEAVQYIDGGYDTLEAIRKIIDSDVAIPSFKSQDIPIITPAGPQFASIGDYIVKVNGKLYVCEKDRFNELFESVI